MLLYAPQYTRFPHIHCVQACDAADGTDVIAAEHSAHPVMGEEIPRNAWSKRHGTDFTGQRLPFGCGVYFKPAVTKYVLDKANARAYVGIFLGYRLAQGCRWNGEYIVADLTDFVNLDLAEAASGQGIHLYEHVTKVVRLPKTVSYSLSHKDMTTLTRRWRACVMPKLNQGTSPSSYWS